MMMMMMMQTSVGPVKMVERIKTRASTESLDYYEMKQHKPWFDEVCSKL
jgi:hypothetical protein